MSPSTETSLYGIKCPSFYICYDFGLVMESCTRFTTSNLWWEKNPKRGGGQGYA